MCTIIEGYSITERILCALDSTAINVVTFANCLVDRLPVGRITVATAIMNGLISGLNITGAPCAQAIDFFDDSLDSLCPGLYDRTNGILNQILNLISF